MILTNFIIKEEASNVRHDILENLYYSGAGEGTVRKFIMNSAFKYHRLPNRVRDLYWDLWFENFDSLAPILEVTLPEFKRIITQIIYTLKNGKSE